MLIATKYFSSVSQQEVLHIEIHRLCVKYCWTVKETTQSNEKKMLDRKRQSHVVAVAHRQ